MKLGDIVDRFDWRRAAKLLGTVIGVAVVFLFVSAAVPQLVGADESYVVLSDSMSPAIGAGSVVYVDDVPTGQIGKDDVITFRNVDGEGRVTHRVVEVVERDGQPQFRTKGDANEEPDADLVSASRVIGRVAFSVPLIGYVVSFAGTDLGIALLVIVPASLLAVTELWDLFVASGGDEPNTEADGETE
ncbi:signal peptidase I [Halosimplex sp. TS25]|uniref:signal peptidase I n=1 Tax=Halosimplex rarum TaxID=3396619 RepID=UPI0039E7FB81